MAKPTAREALGRNVERGVDAALSMALLEALERIEALQGEVSRLGRKVEEVGGELGALRRREDGSGGS